MCLGWIVRLPSDKAVLGVPFICSRAFLLLFAFMSEADVLFKTLMIPLMKQHPLCSEEEASMS